MMDYDSSIKATSWMCACKNVGNFILKSCRNNTIFMIGLSMVLIILLIALFAPYLAPYPPSKMHPRDAFTPPFNPSFYLGTDEFGRDIFSRILFGTRVSLIISLSSTMIAAAVGITLGIITGFYGGWVDHLIMRLMDIILSFPALLLAIIIVAIAGPGLFNAIIAIGFVYAPRFVRMIRGSVLEIKECDFCQAAVALGASNLRIMLVHIFRNVLPLVIIYASLVFSYGILAEAGLSFLGLGVQPPHPSWGGMLRAGRDYLTLSSGLSIFPGLAIMFGVLGFNFLGDGLRDILDPRLKDK